MTASSDNNPLCVGIDVGGKNNKAEFLTRLFLQFSAFRQSKPLSNAFGATATALIES